MVLWGFHPRRKFDGRDSSPEGVGQGDPSTRDSTILFVSIWFFTVSSAVAYFILINVFYIPKPNSAWAVFLAPRWYGGTNDLPSAPLSNWTGFLVFSACLGVVVALLVRWAIFPFVGRRLYGIALYFTALGIALATVWLSPTGLSHAAAQVVSINNGSYSTVYSLSQSPEFQVGDFGVQLRYLFGVIGANDSGYTVPGSTHPPGLLAFALLLYSGTRQIAGGDLGLAAYLWAAIVTGFSALLLPIGLAISRRMFSETTARLSVLFMLVVPSIAFHLCAMIDAVAGVFVALAALLLLRQIGCDEESLSTRDSSARWSPPALVAGFAVGTLLVIALQFTYGHAIAVVALLLAFVVVYRPRVRIAWLRMVAGLTLAAGAYFAVEYWLSSGHSFWPVRAVSMARIVGSGLDAARPYPLAQLGNFVLVAAWGGLLVLPTAAYSIWKVGLLPLFRTAARREPERDALAPTLRFMMIALGSSTVLLLIQSSVRLEVERTWFWYFTLAWPLGGLAISALTRGSPTESRSTRYLWPALLIFSQLGITLAFVLSLQDYY
jgi:hypothetical protein